MKSETKNNLSLYIEHVMRYSRLFKWLFIFYLIKHLPFISIPLIIKLIVDSYIPAADVMKIWYSIAVVVFFGITNVVFHTGYSVLRTEILKNISRDFRNTIVHKLQILSLSYHNKSQTGRYYSKIMIDVEHCESFGNAFLDNIWSSIITVLYASLVLAVVNAGLLLIYIVGLPLYILLYLLFKQKFNFFQHEARMAREDLSQAVNTFIQTSSLVRIHGEEKFESDKVNKKSEHIIKKYKKLAGFMGLFSCTASVTGQTYTIIIVAISAIAVIQKKMLIGELFLFLQYMNMIINNINQVINQMQIFTEFNESLNSIHEILNSPDIEHNAGKQVLETINGDIDFTNVFFNFGNLPVFTDISVSVKAGTTVALVGPSGSGKSTFVNLILGLYRPQNGAVLIDGIPINAIDMRSIRKMVGVVTQEPILFTGTIADNISHANKTSRMSDIINAAIKANAHDFISSLDEGYNTMIGERGATLSGGQRQRIAIARAILRKPRILILDEATSALDSESEREVQQAIEKMLGKQTTFIIAHRLSTVFHADIILVFKNGIIAEKGSHNELIDLKGEYARLLSAQLNMDIDKLSYMKI